MATQTHVIASSSVQPSSATSTGANTSSANHVIGGKFRVGKKIGEGSFGVVFEGEHVETHRRVAIKFEPRKSDAPQLRDEYRSYRTLKHIPGIPEVHHFGQEGLHNVLVIDLLGPNLEDLFDMCGRKFSVKTVSMLAKQMISRVQTVHEKSLIYRDIKPDNFLIGPSGSPLANMVHLIDFGMAKHYRDPKTKQHIPYRERKSLSGTARYMSINTHLGREQSRRDDLESLGHVFMYFIRGGLPWQGLKAATNKQKYEKIGEKKQSVSISELCDGFPEEFQIYMNYVRKLGFEESPDYDFLRELFSKVLKNIHENDDSVFDWMLLNGGKGWEGVSQMNAHVLAAALIKDRDRDREREREHRRERDRADREHRRPSRAIEQSQSQSPNPSGSAAALVSPSTGNMNVLLPGAAAVMAGKSGRRHQRERDRVEREREQRIGGIGIGNLDTSLSVQPIAPSSRRGSGQVVSASTSAGGVKNSIDLTGGTIAGTAGGGPGHGHGHPYANASNANANTNTNMNTNSGAGPNGNMTNGYRIPIIGSNSTSNSNSNNNNNTNNNNNNSPLPPLPNESYNPNQNQNQNRNSESDGYTYRNGSPYLQGIQGNGSSTGRNKLSSYGMGTGMGMGMGMRDANGMMNGNGNVDADAEMMRGRGRGGAYGGEKRAGGGGFLSVLCCRG